MIAKPAIVGAGCRPDGPASCFLYTPAGWRHIAVERPAPRYWSMIRKSGNRLSEKIMLKQKVIPV